MIVEDEKSVSNNFKEKTSGVKTVMFFKLQTNHDTVSVMPGEWSTSRTKKFLPITGSVSVSREKNYLATQLYKRLDEKQLGKEMMFDEKVQPQTNLAVAQTDQTKKTVNPPANKREDVGVTPPAANQPQPTKDTVQKTSTTLVNNSTSNKPADVAVQPKQSITTKPQESKDSVSNTINNNVNTTNKPKPADIAVQQNKPTAPPTQQPTAAVKDSVKTTTTASTVNKPTVNTTSAAVTQTKPVTTQPTTTKPATVIANPSPQTGSTTNPQQQKTTTTVITNKPAVNNTVQQQTTVATTKPATKPVDQKPTTPLAATPQTPSISSVGNTIVEHTTAQPTGPSKHPVINNPVIVKRQTEIIDALELTGDSITLSLYDNGEIDGDTVSVFVNNELVVSKVGLKATAYKKTIAIQPGEIIQLTLFAENLGSIPPNTGLLVVTTNNERYQVHFSSTLNKNSSVVLRRKE